jgi:hypothetical protein
VIEKFSGLAEMLLRVCVITAAVEIPNHLILFLTGLRKLHISITPNYLGCFSSSLAFWEPSVEI